MLHYGIIIGKKLTSIIHTAFDSFKKMLILLGLIIYFPSIKGEITIKYFSHHNH
jgi:hypothetical protein